MFQRYEDELIDFYDFLLGSHQRYLPTLFVLLLSTCNAVHDSLRAIVFTYEAMLSQDNVSMRRCLLFRHRNRTSNCLLK